MVQSKSLDDLKRFKLTEALLIKKSEDVSLHLSSISSSMEVSAAENWFTCLSIYFDLLDANSNGLYLNASSPCNLFVHHVAWYISVALKIINDQKLPENLKALAFEFLQKVTSMGMNAKVNVLKMSLSFAYFHTFQILEKENDFIKSFI